MAGWFGKTPKRNKDRFGAKPKARGARLFGAPPKRKAKDRNFGRADKRSKQDKTFGKVEKRGKDAIWGKEPAASEREEQRRTKGFGLGWLGRMAKRKRRAAELNRYWSVRDDVKDEIQRKSHVIETRLNNTSNEIGLLVSQIAGKPLTGDQKARIATFIDDKKRQVTEAVGVVEQAVQLVGAFFGRFKPGG
jgi:hypothetical protein